MALQRAQIEAVLEDIATSALQRLRADPDDAGVSQLVVDRTRALLREVAIEHHLHICDTAQHLLLTLGVDDDDGEDGQEERDDVVPPLPDVGLQLLDDPFDVDSFMPPGTAEDPQRAMPEFVPEAEPAACPPVALEQERRGEAEGPDDVALRRGLTRKQLATLDTMSNFGWTLRFVRRPMFLPPIPVAFDRNRDRYVVVEPDGSVDEDPGLQVRD